MNTILQAPIIHAPQRQSSVGRTLFGAITLLAWALYLYLILPLLTLILWALGLRSAYVHWWLPPGGFDPNLGVTLPLLALACAVLLVGWAEYNRYRFADKERRNHVPDVTKSHSADELGASSHLARQLRSSRIATLFLDEQAQPVRVHAHVPDPQWKSPR